MRPRTREAFAGRVIAVTTGLAVGLASCGSVPKPSADPGGPAFTSTPLATSVQTAAGTWATVPMGHLGQPLNTFWQLFFRAGASGPWSNHVEAAAVATNGGLVLATGDGSLLVGVRPINLLTFSPLLATADAGRTWADGLVPQGLADHPGSLAIGRGGRSLAIVTNRQGDEVLGTTGNLTSWHPVVTEAAILAASGGRACGPTAFTAVGYLGDRAVVGARCNRAGAVGLWAEAGHRWAPVGPRLTPPAGRAEVLGVVHSGGQVATLVALSGSAGTSLMAAWTTNGRSWTESPTLPLGRGTTLVSFGQAAHGALFALVKEDGGADELDIAGPSSPSRSAGGSAVGAAWHHVTAPAGTGTVAFGPGATIEALVPRGTMMTVWAIGGGQRSWSKRQVVHVDLVYGSSG